VGGGKETLDNTSDHLSVLVVCGKDLAAKLVQHLIISLCTELFFGVRTNDIEAPTMSDGDFFEIEHVEGGAAAGDNQDGCAVVPPNILRSVGRTEVGPLLLLASFASESLILVGGKAGLDLWDER
jgi:hypothetical protein